MIVTLKKFTLIKKVKLTDDVFEMHFLSDIILDFKSWQFITFILPWIWWRAYSILEIVDWNMIKLIIKRLENGRWWSKFICDSEIWYVFQWVWPTWHFVLNEVDNNKLFLWTWTWFVPLYNQIIKCLSLWYNSNIKLVFWLRNIWDVFYSDILINLSKYYSNFTFEYFLSKDNIEWFNYWRITSFLLSENIKNFSEFYICWSPMMIDDCIEKLNILWVSNDQIFTEKY